MKLPWIGAIFVGCGISLAAGPEYFAIEAVDAETGRGIPLVELRTVNAVSYWTDSAGRVAFREPGLMGKEVFFEVRSDGYEYPADGFGYRGFRARAEAGERHRVELKRIYAAERLYRLTGAGIYRDSILLGLETPVEKPLLNGKVLGQDSVLAVPYRGEVYWFWGDTQRAAYPLGNFHMAMARTVSGAELEPERGIDFRYFVDENGFAKEMAKMPGEGPTWLSGATVVSYEGEDRLVAGYAKIRGKMEAYARGLAVFDDAAEEFVDWARFPEEAALFPIGHALRMEESGENWVYFCNPLPLIRVKADLEAMANPEMYEAFTPLVVGSRRGSRTVERDAEGNVVWGWKRDTAEVGPEEQAALVEAGILRADERMFGLRDWRTGTEVRLHAGSVNWNPFRKRWVLIASEIFGSSVLGEVWFAEADSPLGPWVYGEKVVSHEKYSFYNPRHHPFLDRDGGRTIYFEGTYSAMFSGVERPTPRYDYNQILYRLDLADARLDLPVAFYRTAEGCVGSAGTAAEISGRPVFWAWEKASERRVGVRCVAETGEDCRFAEAEEGTADFYVAKEGGGWATEMAVRKFSFGEETGKWVELPGTVLAHPFSAGPVFGVDGPGLP